MSRQNSLSCESCRLRRACRDSGASWIFFAIGIIATVAMRVIEPLRGFDPYYAKLAWYVGVVGFFLFFLYKYRESRQRKKVVAEHGLRQKLESDEGLSREDERVLLELICSQDNVKEQINYFAIFGLSLAALLFALWKDL